MILIYHTIITTLMPYIYSSFWWELSRRRHYSFLFPWVTYIAFSLEIFFWMRTKDVLKGVGKRGIAPTKILVGKSPHCTILKRKERREKFSADKDFVHKPRQIGPKEKHISALQWKIYIKLFAASKDLKVHRLC